MVEMDGSLSPWYVLETGIRRGCPLSPYLLLILITVLFHDIQANDAVRTENQRVVGMHADEVLYVDDTICVAQTTFAMNRLLNKGN